MSDVIQGLGVIATLIPQLKSFTGARRREYFEKLITPLFDSFQEVHEFYNDLIVQTRHKVVEAASLNLSRGDDRLSMEQIAPVREIKEEFLRKRTHDEHLRGALRRDAGEMFATISWPEERRFLISVVYYFLGGQGVAPSDEYLDHDLQAVIDRGGNTNWETPSTRLYKIIREESDLGRLLEVLDESRNSLNQLYMNVRHHFRQVQHVIIMKT